MEEPVAAPAAADVEEDDPFAPFPAAKPAAAGPVDDDPFAPAKPAAAPAPAPIEEATPAPVPAAAAPKPNDPFADPFQTAIDGRLPVRQWVDNSGTFRVKGRLILILDGKVRLLKETGRTTTVPLNRLSDADRQYVEQVITRYGDDLTQLDHLASR
jgi:hypothetical protein